MRYTVSVAEECTVIKALKQEYKSLKAALSRASNEEAETRIVNRMTIVLTQLEQLNAKLGKEYRIEKHEWSYEENLVAYAIYRMHGIGTYSRQVSRQFGEMFGMGADSMDMKISAFYSFLMHDGDFTLCQTGKEIAEKYKDYTPEQVEEISGRIVQF